METLVKEKEILTHGDSELSLNPICSRRQMLKIGGMSIIGMSVLGSAFAEGAVKPLIIMEQATGIVTADPNKCVGCGRCELACTEFNDGKAAPTISRIKIDRNLNFGPSGELVLREGKGNWGDGVVVQDLCKQCPHPVPCANICPENAIVVGPVGNARMIDMQKCTGCKVCLKACPWEMISFDAETHKATKCDLCKGKPKCVEACPAEALTYVGWRDLTDKIPPRTMTTARMLEERATACQECHMPGQGKNVEQGFGMLFGSSRKGRPASAGEFGFRWTDLAGSILLPVGIAFVAVHAIVRKVTKK
jgi:Fe-S-cluster-containing dehydrogenase component